MIPLIGRVSEGEKMTMVLVGGCTKCKQPLLVRELGPLGTMITVGRKTENVCPYCGTAKTFLDEETIELFLSDFLKLRQ